MKNFAFDPKNLTLRVGDTVRWVNNSGTPHTSTSGGNWDSSIVASGSSFERKFNSPGTFNYRCDIHPDVQTGTITVQADGGPTATATAIASPSVQATAPPVTPATNDSVSSVAPASAPRAARAAMTVEVAMQDYLFSPATTNIAVGDTVRWANKGNAPHNTTSDGGAWASKQLMNSGESYSFKFTSAGTFTYRCTLHAGQGQKGTIVVSAVAEGTLLPSAGVSSRDTGAIVRTLLSVALGLAGFCAVSASLWARRSS
jgi:plastocyanin